MLLRDAENLDFPEQKAHTEEEANALARSASDLNGRNRAHPTPSQKRSSPKTHDCANSMSDDIVLYYTIWRETDSRLERYAALVREGKDLMPALDFARYVLCSGVIKLCEAHAMQRPFKIDGALLRWKATELQHSVQECFRTGKTKFQVEETQIEAINRKLDLIAGHVAKMPTQ